MGYEAYRKLQGEFIDFETGEILDERMWSENMSDDVYQKYLYGQKWSEIRKNIIEAEKNVKFWHYVYHKCNRGLSNQTIRGTREYNGKICKTYTLDIRKKEGIKVFKGLIFDECKRERLLVYRNDPKTFEHLMEIWCEYEDADNPFLQYEKETGDVVRKYAKKHNGPKISKLKYTGGEIGTCIDISHKYGFEKGSKRVVLESLTPYRTDVYYKADLKQYFLIGIKHADIKCEAGKYVIDEDAYARILVAENMINEGETRKDLERLGYEFRFTLYENDIIEYERNGEIFKERFGSRTMQNRNYITTKPIGAPKFDNNDRKKFGLPKTTMIRKYRVDILGNQYLCDKEEFRRICK